MSILMNVRVYGSVVVLVLASACMRKPATTLPGTVNPADSSYTDLKPGDRLRILVPLLKAGGYQAATDAAQMQGTVITLSAANLIGYETSFYAIEGRRGGKIRLRFTSAEISKDGKTIQEQQPPALPFPLPAKPQYVRLLYLIRSSRADHNMAIIGAGDRRALAVFTSRLKEDPDLCGAPGKTFCAWVPSGIAVRPERAGERD